MAVGRRPWNNPHTLAKLKVSMCKMADRESVNVEKVAQQSAGFLKIIIWMHKRENKILDWNITNNSRPTEVISVPCWTMWPMITRCCTQLPALVTRNRKLITSPYKRETIRQAKGFRSIVKLYYHLEIVWSNRSRKKSKKKIRIKREWRRSQQQWRELDRSLPKLQFFFILVCLSVKRFFPFLNI